jgi:hypothetical protein
VAESRADDRVTIEVELGQEFAAPWDRDRRVSATTLCLTLTPEDLRAAATAWDEERSPFPDGSAVNLSVDLLVDGNEVQGTLTVADVRGAGGRTPGFSLMLASGDLHWTAVGPDGFAALRNLMARLDRSGVRIGVEGARPNAWPSSGQRHTGDGLTVRLLRPPLTPGRRPFVRTFTPIPINEAGSLAEQDAFQRECNHQSGRS